MTNIYNECLVCPITFLLFEDPVTAEDGNTYERSAIIQWIQCNSTSPLTREAITVEGLRPNRIVKRLVDEFRKTIANYRYKFKLDVDIKRSQTPFFQTTGKALYDAKWIGYPNGPPIVLLRLYGARAKREAQFYESLTRHPYIVYTYGLVEPIKHESTYIMLLQEKAPEGSLLNYLEHRSECQSASDLPIGLLNEIFRQVSNAMIFLTEKEIIHGDLACRNVLVFRIDENEPQQTLVKLTDFGISRGNPIYSKIDSVATVIDIVPIRSAAPEILQDEPNYSEKSDIYAMGVLMRETFTNGKLPWEEFEKESIIRQKVINGERLSRPMNCKSDEHWNLILKCMIQDPNERPTFRELEEQLKNLIKSNKKQIRPTVPKPTIIPKNEISLINTSEIEPDNSDTCRQTSVAAACAGVDVKSRRSLFEQKSEQNQIQPRLSTKASLKKIVPPPAELIELTKWH